MLVTRGQSPAFAPSFRPFATLSPGSEALFSAGLPSTNSCSTWGGRKRGVHLRPLAQLAARLEQSACKTDATASYLWINSSQSCYRRRSFFFFLVFLCALGAVWSGTHGERAGMTHADDGRQDEVGSLEGGRVPASRDESGPPVRWIACAIRWPWREDKERRRKTDKSDQLFSSYFSWSVFLVFCFCSFFLSSLLVLRPSPFSSPPTTARRGVQATRPRRGCGAARWDVQILAWLWRPDGGCARKGKKGHLDGKADCQRIRH